MIIDSHQHFLFPSTETYSWLTGESLRPLMRDFTPRMLEDELRRNGVSKTLLVQTKSSLQETRDFLKIAAVTPYIAGVVGWIDLTDERAGQVLDELLASPAGHLLVGIRHQVQDEEPTWLLREDVHHGLHALAERHLTYDLLILPRHLDAAAEVVRRHPDLTFVIDHLAKPDLRFGDPLHWTSALQPLALLPNTFIKLSGLITEVDWVDWRPSELVPYFHTAIELFGPDRCLFGSDWPVCLLAADYEQVLNVIQQALKSLGEEAQQDVFAGSATRAYRLDRQERL